VSGPEGPIGSEPIGSGPIGSVVLTAPAKLTLSLRVTGVRSDGYHLLESEMVTLDLADTLVVADGDGLTVSEQFAGGTGIGDWRTGGVDPGPDNLVARALAAVGRTARVDLLKRIPPGAGLGGGSADAAAILRWAGRTDRRLAARLGADIPFCLAGGRALVRGIGEEVVPLPFVERAFTLFLLPFGMDTGAVYAAWDTRQPGPRAVGPGDVEPGTAGPGIVGLGDGANDLEAAALDVDPRLRKWRDHLAGLIGRRPWLAGSGSTWFVEGPPDQLGLGGRTDVRMGEERALIVPVRTTPAVGTPGATSIGGRA
jgi:4-diphosphocytidyl-2-C-methyl-D-erythritol kinase